MAVLKSVVLTCRLTKAAVLVEQFSQCIIQIIFSAIGLPLETDQIKVSHKAN